MKHTTGLLNVLNRALTTLQIKPVENYFMIQEIQTAVAAFTVAQSSDALAAYMVSLNEIVDIHNVAINKFEIEFRNGGIGAFSIFEAANAKLSEDVIHYVTKLRTAMEARIEEGLK